MRLLPHGGTRGRTRFQDQGFDAALDEGEACVCDISAVGVSQPAVSHHLKKLKEAGLLTSERRGTWVYHRGEPSAMAAMGRMLATWG